LTPPFSQGADDGHLTVAVSELSFFGYDRETMRRLLILLATIAAFAALPAFADKGGHGDDDDRSRVARAREQAEIMPIEKLVALLGEKIGGEIVEIEIEDDHGRLVYEVYYLDASGRRHEVKVDAASGAIIEREADD
jgi:uncharacterized membrane protein YkoI